jgi:hypothetical protein
VVGDRLSFRVELVPYLFGAANRFPSGQRDVLAIWRTCAAVVVPTRLATSKCGSHAAEKGGDGEEGGAQEGYEQAHGSAATPDKLRATTTFVADVAGDPMIVHASDVVSSKRAVVKGTRRCSSLRTCSSITSASRCRGPGATAVVCPLPAAALSGSVFAPAHLPPRHASRAPSLQPSASDRSGNCG